MGHHHLKRHITILIIISIPGGWSLNFVLFFFFSICRQASNAYLTFGSPSGLEFSTRTGP